MKARQQSEGNFKTIPIGMHRAVFTGLVDLGLQPGGMYAPAYKLAIIWHLPDQLTDPPDQKVMSIAQKLTASMHQKANLRKMIESLFGKQFPNDQAAKDFDLRKLLGRACLLNVKHDTKGDKTYANVQTVTPLVQGMESPVYHGELLCYSEDMSLEERKATYLKLPEWLRKAIDEQLQPEASSAPQPEREPGSDDDIPF